MEVAKSEQCLLFKPAFLKSKKKFRGFPMMDRTDILDISERGKQKSAQITPSSSEQRQWWKWESNSALRLSRLKSRDLARTTFHRRCILYSIENICLDSAFWSLLLIAPLIAILNMRVIIPKWTEQYCLARLDPAVLLYNSEETCGGASVLHNTKDVPSHSWH